MWLLGDHGRLIKWHPLVKFQFVGMTLKMKFKEQNFTLFAYTVIEQFKVITDSKP